MFRKNFKVASLLPLCILASCHSQSEPLNYNFRELKFDPEGRFIRLQRLPAKPASGSYYFISRGATIDIVYHFADVGGGPSRIVLDSSTDENRKLLETIRFEPIVSGAFGRLFLTKRCYYKKPPSKYSNTLGIDSYLDRTSDIYSSPISLSMLPADHPRITAITLVRIYQVSSGFQMTAATYGATGLLDAVYENWVKPGGQHISGEAHYSDLPGTKMAPQLQQRAKALGLLPEFSVANYLNHHLLPLSSVANPEIKSMVVLRYGFDDLLQIDTLHNGQPVSSSYLKPQIAPEDLSLNQRCNADFEGQLASHLRTSW